MDVFYLMILVLFLLGFFVCLFVCLFCFRFYRGRISFQKLTTNIGKDFVKSWKKLIGEGEGINFNKRTGWHQEWTVFYCDETVKFTALKIKTRLFDDFLPIYIKKQVAYSFLFCSFYGAELYTGIFFLTFFKPPDFPIFQNNIRVTKMVFNWYNITS